MKLTYSKEKKNLTRPICKFGKYIQVASEAERIFANK